MDDTRYRLRVQQELNKICVPTDRACENRRLLFLDLVAYKGDNFSQEYLTRNILKNPVANETDMERVLTLIVRLQHPILVILLLSNEAKMIIKPRKKRSVREFDKRRHLYIQTKLTLIHALGNAARGRSVSLITSYMDPHDGHNDWKHAAIHGLRFYSCNESADALVRSFAADCDDLVREMAYKMYKNHPLAGDGHNKRHKDVIRSLRYTYQHLVRLKRSIITAEFKDGGIYFSIQLPGIDWNKRVGISAVGAGFGLTIRNGMEVDVKPLQGYAEVDIYDEAYIKVFLGWFGLEFSIVHAFYCYQGHIRYDLNILKDFGINDIQDLANIFDKVYDAIVRPIETAISAFKAIIELFKGGLQNIINEIVTLLRNLPVILNTLVEDLAEAVLKALKYKAYPWINQIQKIVLKARFFIEDIKADVLGFYNTIADAVTVTLPYGAKKIYDAVAGINNGFKNFFKNPVQAIFGVGRAVLETNFIEQLIMIFLFLFKESHPFGLNYDDDLFEVLDDISDLIDMVTDPSTVSSSSANITSILSDGIKSVDDHTNEIKDALNKAFGTFSSLMTSALDRLGKPFFDAFRSVMEAVRGIKLSFENLRDMVIKAKSLVEKVFGPKFHVNFPSRRRDPVSDCGQGVWPTTTNGKYSTEGVDVLAKKGEKIICPVNGIAKRIGGNRIIIQPKDDDFLDLEIVIDNISPSSEVDEGGKYLRAGEDHIGTADNSPCKPNFIHVAVRQTPEDGDILSDAEYEYVDPSKYLDRLIPYPKWVETCNDHYIKIFGIVVDADILAAAAEGWDALVKRVAEKVQEKVEEKFEDIANDMEDKVYDIVLSTGQTPQVAITPLHKLDSNPEVYRPPGMDLVDYNNPKSHQAWADFKNGLKGVLGQFKDIAKQLFDFSPNRTGVNILDVVDINKYTVGQIRDIVDQRLSTELDLIYAKFQEIQASIPTEHLQGLSLTKMRQMLRFSFDKVTGSQSQMISKILGMAEHGCPQFKGHLTKGEGHVCFAHPDCQGLMCGISLPYGGYHEMFQVDIRIDPCTNSLNVSAPNHDTVTVQLLSGEFSVPISFGDKSVDGLSVSLIVDGYSEASDATVYFSVSAEICALGFESCLPDIDLLTEMTLDTGGSCSPAESKYSITNLEKLTLQELIDVLADFNLLNKDVLDVLDTLREAVLKELLEDPRTILKVLGVEFKNKLDFCKEVGKPFPTYDIPLYFGFWVVFVGPIPVIFKFGASAAAGLDMRFGICFLSFKCETTLTPWGGAKVYGGAHVWLFVFEAGVVLTGHVLDTRFPIYGGVQFNKFPIDVLATMDLYMVPLRVVLSAYCRFVFRICFWKCFTIRITLFDGIIWQFSTPTIRSRILTIGNEGQDLSPPTFDDNGKRVSSVSPQTVDDNGRQISSGSSPTFNNNGRQISSVSPPTFNANVRAISSSQQVSSGCELYQIPGRNPSDTAFKLRATVSDDITEAKLFFAIGTSQGATNVIGWTDMGGSLLVYAVDLPNSVPLYWTLKAVNNQGLETYTDCMLNTYDNTVPDGRVDPSFIYSSHPDTLSATIIAFDDSPLMNKHLVGLGYSSGAYGNEVVGWRTFSLSDSSIRHHIPTDLKHFSEPKPGKLTTAPFATHVKERPSDCANECIMYPSKCVSFDYDYFTETCDLQAYVEGPAAKLRASGHYVNYERLGIGQNAFVEFNNLPLEHANVYFFNAIINNTLNYTGVMHSTGTMVDFTPPEPGALGRFYKEELRADGCHASYDQKGRCINVTPLPNHRVIEDGNESSTVFNGHRPLQDMRYTRSNHFASVNFDGFRDNETGIFRYMWAVGRVVCGYDIVDFQDPHEFLHSSRHWTHSAYQKNLTLKDGLYYVTVQALNNIIHGGALVTTLCHTVPFAVDTTPPDFHGVEEIYYDEDFDLLGVYYKADDPLSGLYSVDFGLGKTKYDVLVRRYSYHPPMDRKDPYVVIEDLGLEDGVPSWIRIRPMNNVRLFTAGHGDEPILIDRTPPIAGNVLDGAIVLHDVTYQADNSQICAHWNSFYDPESGILEFRWGVGTNPGLDDVASFRNYTHNIRHACVDVQLTHNTTYFSTVIVFNGALNTKNSNSSSNGVLIDITPPVAGNVHDGDIRGLDISYSSETAAKSCYWGNFSDPESGITKYDVAIFINHELEKSFDVGMKSDFLDHSVTLYHEDEVKFAVTATNGAGSTTVVSSDGFKVDHTPPEMILLSVTNSSSRYQTFSDRLVLQWQFRDRESGVKEYRYFIYEDKHGSKSRYWPALEPYVILVPTVQGGKESILLTRSLSNGGKYSLHVTAINNAGLSTAYESESVTVDSTPPVMTQVHIGLADEDEEVNENGQVEHPDPDGITVSWNGFDQESKISSFYVAVGTSPGDTSVTGQYIAMLTEQTSYIKVPLETFSDSNKVYYVSVKAKNHAGLFSQVMVSSPIIVLKENIPGVIFDGRKKYEDVKMTSDTSSISLSFMGFESEACNIVGYELAVGSQPYFSDISSFNDFGIVHNGTHGHAERNIDLQEQSTYYSTIRAITGHNCHEDFIVSTSDGITPDATKPKVLEIVPINLDKHYSSYNEIYYQNELDTLDVTWNVTDQSNDLSINYSAGHLPFLTDIFPSTMTNDGRTNPGSIRLREGESAYFNVEAEDEVGNLVSASSPQIIADTTKPKVSNLTCTDMISEKQPVITCEWLSQEFESSFKAILLSVGTSETSTDIIDKKEMPISSSHWKADLRNNNEALKKSSVYVTMQLMNVLDMEDVYVTEIKIDHTPPTVSSVEIITWTRPLDQHTQKVCQLPWTYADIKINGADDSESGISRAEVCLGTIAGKCDIRPLRDYQENANILFTDLSMYPGEKIFATTFIYNRVGLSTMAFSDGSVVSPNPILSVIDGAGPMDRDFQSDLNVIQGIWVYSEPCPIVKAEWAIHDLKGNLVQDYIGAAGNGHILYNDELTLENNMMYMISVRITDAINRTAEAQSDGMVILIQPPGPGDVRDGLGGEDIDYQESITQLSANWENFGSLESSNPTQMIDHYEVAIGDDRREHTSRVNIHYFINVGLNKSVTISNLNLTAKTVTYYITVRAYSMTGAYEEAYTNGIRVGYREGVFPGEVEYTPFQHITDSISISWKDFEADVGIDKYIVGISTSAVIEHNETFKCELIHRNMTGLFDTLVPANVGLDTLQTFRNLTLQHGQAYFMTVFAADIIGMCAAATGGPIIVDITPPNSSSLSIRLNQRDVTGNRLVFVDDERQAMIEFVDVVDPQSGIRETNFQLIKFISCPNGSISNDDRILMKEMMVENDTKISFFDVGLETDNFYKILATSENHAGLKVDMESPIFKLDRTDPLPGSVKIGTDFRTLIDFQSSVHEITAYTALARTQQAYECPNSKQLFPSNSKTLIPLDGDYSDSMVEKSLSDILLHIGYDIALTKVLKSGVQSIKQPLIEGTYRINMVSASGKNIITTFSLSTINNYFPTKFDFPYRKGVQESDFNNAVNISSLEVNYENRTTGNTSVTSTATPTTSASANVNNSNSESGPLKTAADIGFGFHILGSRQNNSEEWDILVWAADRYKTDEQWITSTTDPSSSLNTYSFDLVEKKGVAYHSWDITFKINNQAKAIVDGLRFPDEMHMFLQTWNKDGYEEPITDPFHPYRSRVNIKEVVVPLGVDKPCLHGKGFYDGESGITEVWVGVSDNVNEIDNIKKLFLYESICIPCINECTIACDPNCFKTEDFEIKKLTIDNLDLVPTIANTDGSNATALTEIRNSSSYYVNIKSVNLAGGAVIARSNPIMIDNTPPKCQQMVCTDPVNTGLDEPTDYLGSNGTVGAYWRCEDDVTEITSYVISVGIDYKDDSLFKETNIGLITKARIDLNESKVFEHGKTYFVNIKVQNSAGLSSNYSCSTTVYLLAPNVSATQSETLYTDPSQTSINDAYIIHQQDRVGMLWRSPYNDTEFYEFQVGSENGSSDLIPRITVSVLQEGSVAVIDGQLWLNGNNTNRSVSDFSSRNMKNVTESDNANTVQDYSFMSEPGRCLYPKLYAVGYSHLSAEIPSKPVCIASEDGGMITGMLSSADFAAQYGSASSAGFVSYIADPVTTIDYTDRFIRKRLVQSMGVSFFVSPAPSATLEMITVSIRIDTIHFENDTVPALVVWNYHVSSDNPYDSSGVWMLVEELCGGDALTPRIENGIYIVEVCPQALEMTTTARSKRTTSSTVTTPTQLSLMALNTSYYNIPPVIDTDEIHLAEDTRADEQILWHDDDFDGVTFALGAPPHNGTANITDDGFLTYIPDPNYAGTDHVEVLISENSTINPATVSKYIQLLVSDVNDPPISGYTYNDTSYEALLNNTVDILFEANTTHRHLLDFYLADIDYNETLTVLSSASNTINVSFLLTEITETSLPLDLFHGEPVKYLREFKVDMIVEKEFYGDFSYYLLGHDKSNYYTERLEAHVYILKHPCVFGECQPKSNDSEPCNDVIRATTFNPFVCSCYPGYKGEWCQIDIDECLGDPCGIMNHCIDRINYYQCRPHVGKWVAVVFGILVFL
ncbi:hypothetical protein FSP39_024081 [Pinctada imbricata]|uniref:Uncharacterized protein n=1 Tax=Pinctada imbricata TaxID=66713 RepID=A0AA88XX67_PINIB|nr:hypothetical protein FSP39_024081 [Pinctada imbricata]